MSPTSFAFKCLPLCVDFSIAKAGFRETEMERERDEQRVGQRGAFQSSLLPVKGFTPLTPTFPTCLPATSHSSHRVTHFFPWLGWAVHRLQSAAACVWVNVCVCPSTNSALSFSWICSDCPHTKLSAGPAHQYFIPRCTICCTVQGGASLFLLHLSYTRWLKFLKLHHFY